MEALLRQFGGLWQDAVVTSTYRGDVAGDAVTGFLNGLDARARSIAQLIVDSATIGTLVSQALVALPAFRKTVRPKG